MFRAVVVKLQQASESPRAGMSKLYKVRSHIF